MWSSDPIVRCDCVLLPCETKKTEICCVSLSQSWVCFFDNVNCYRVRHRRERRELETGRFVVVRVDIRVDLESWFSDIDPDERATARNSLKSIYLKQTGVFCVDDAVCGILRIKEINSQKFTAKSMWDENFSFFKMRIVRDLYMFPDLSAVHGCRLRILQRRVLHLRHRQQLHSKSDLKRDSMMNFMSMAKDERLQVKHQKFIFKFFLTVVVFWRWMSHKSFNVRFIWFHQQWRFGCAIVWIAAAPRMDEVLIFNIHANNKFETIVHLHRTA